MSSRVTDEILNERLRQSVLERTWFYRFRLPDGAVTRTDSNQEVLNLHEARRRAMLHVLDLRFPERVREIDAIDLASHEGWFSLELAKRVRRVRGYDINPASVEAAQRVCALFPVANLEFAIADVRAMQAPGTPPAEFVLLFGLLYHVEDPFRILRIAASLATDTLLIETQLTGWDISGAVEFGSYEWRKPILGWFALVDDDHNREGGTTGVALIPSLEAVRQSLLRLGFVRVQVIDAFNAGAEQLRRGQRAIIAAFRT